VPWLSLQGSQSVHSTRGFLQKLFACKSSKRGWSNDSYNEYFQIALKKIILINNRHIFRSTRS